jgi:hypothetical protein
MQSRSSLKIGHDRPESAVTTNQNRRSRSAGMTGHDGPEYPALRNTVKGNHKLEKEISDRVRKKAEEIFETPQAAQLWMHKPHPALEGQTPDDALKTPEGAKRVRDILVSMRRGGIV